MKIIVKRFKKRTKGLFLWKQQWISFCSRHGDYDETCSICTHGFWRSSVIIWLENLLYKISYKWWFYYMNGNFPEEDYRKTHME